MIPLRLNLTNFLSYKEMPEPLDLESVHLACLSGANGNGKSALLDHLIAGASELGKRSSVAGAILVSLPLTSLLAMLWLWHDTRDPARLASFSMDILWLVIPSLVLFVVLAWLLRSGFHFWWSLAAAIAATLIAYGASLLVLGRLK